MDTLIQVTEKRITQSRDLKPGDIISQEFLDEGDWKSRQIRVDSVTPTYLAYHDGGRTYLVPVVLVHGWDVRKGRGVRLVSASQRPWETQRTQ